MFGVSGLRADPFGEQVVDRFIGDQSAHRRVDRFRVFGALRQGDGDLLWVRQLCHRFESAARFVGYGDRQGQVEEDGFDLAGFQRFHDQVKDDPAYATEDALSGVNLIEAPDMEAALEAAAKLPSARWGSVEVRPLMEYKNNPDETYRAVRS